MPPAFRTLTFEREMCFGDCPVYKLTISADGLVSWQGIDYVREKGLRSWTISEETIGNLRQCFEAAKFDLMGDYTSLDCTDEAWCSISVEYEDGRTKSVRHYFGDMSAPKNLLWLENQIDRLSGALAYIRRQSE
jgi:hypothetical protein